MASQLARITFKYVPEQGLFLEPENIEASRVEKLFDRERMLSIGKVMFATKTARITFKAIQEKLTAESVSAISSAATSFISAQYAYKSGQELLAKERQEQREGKFSSDLMKLSEGKDGDRAAILELKTTELTAVKQQTDIEVEFTLPPDC